MSIIELLEKIGSENIMVQHVDECMISANYRKKHNAVDLRIGTTGITLSDLLSDKPSKNMGMVIWFDRSLWPGNQTPEIQESLKSTTTAP